MSPEIARRFAIAISASLLGIAGCAIRLKDMPLDPPPQTGVGSVHAARATEGITGLVGWGRLSLFAIPVAPVFIVDDTEPSASNTRAEIGNREVMKQVRRALAVAGYQVDAVEPGAPPPGRVLQCKVEKFRFSNYTWLVPIVPTWGGVELTTTVMNGQGNALWSQSFEGSGFTLDFFDGYTSAANQSMKKILSQMVTAFASDTFRQAAIERAAPVASRSPAATVATAPR